MKTSKTFLVTLTYEEDQQDDHQFTDANLEQGLKFVTEASLPVNVNARRAYTPEEIQQPLPAQIIIH